MARPPIDQNVTWVYTDDLEGTCRFYAGTLGLVQVLDQGGCRIFKASASAFLGVCKVRPGRHVEPKGVVITFVTSDVDGWHRHLLARGVTPEAPPERSEKFNVYCFFAKDPNGYLLEFQTFLDPGWRKD
ncbi:MAG: VOC family protein [Alphaproteobacteria bacterium]|nr:VOC family protein [Alphaproteobacteria bacterium]